MSNDIFEKKIKPILVYVGTIGAVMMSIAYIVTVFVLIFGFKVENILNISIFSLVNAAVGFCIMQFLKVQGISFAKEIPENKSILKEYYNKKTKDKKLHSINYYWITSVTKDVLIKCGTLAISTIGVIYIVVQGSKDFALIGLAIVNLIMFLSFGLLAMAKSYDFFNNNHIPYCLEQLKQASLEAKKETKECLISETKSSETCKSKSRRTQMTSNNSEKVSKSVMQ